MRKILLLLVITTFLFACKEENTKTPVISPPAAIDITSVSSYDLTKIPCGVVTAGYRSECAGTEPSD